MAAPMTVEAYAAALRAAARAENKRLRAVMTAALPPDMREAWERRKLASQGCEAKAAKAVALHRDGHSVAEIAEGVDRSRDWVREQLRRAGVVIEGGAALKERRRARIVALAAEGQTAAQIARDVGVHPNSVRNCCRRWGVALTRERAPRRRGSEVIG